MLIACTAFAQITRMTGVVLSAEDDEPILGATVRVTGSKNTTATDINGKFTLTNLKPTDRTITVTFVGMESQTVKIAPEVTIKLKTSSKVMDEVVVVAFGKQKREAFTGSAGVLKGENLTLQQANDPISALEGKVSGVSIVSGNDPTAEPEITIRGITSLNAGSSPLIVVDGLPYNGYYSDINPADVENITVLKDAASNALYGARGANGVIMITTKSASRGNTAVTFDMKWVPIPTDLLTTTRLTTPANTTRPIIWLCATTIHAHRAWISTPPTPLPTRISAHRLIWEAWNIWYIPYLRTSTLSVQTVDSTPTPCLATAWLTRVRYTPLPPTAGVIMVSATASVRSTT